MRKPAFCICENKDADQLRGCNRSADQGPCVRFIDSTIPVLPKPVAIFYGCSALFVLDLDKFSLHMAQITFLADLFSPYQNPNL